MELSAFNCPRASNVHLSASNLIKLLPFCIGAFAPFGLFALSPINLPTPLYALIIFILKEQSLITAFGDGALRHLYLRQKLVGRLSGSARQVRGLYWVTAISFT
jgi:hypothetical protein